MSGYESVSEIDIAASPDEVFAALTDSAKFGQAMFGTDVDTTWEPGSPILYSGEFDGTSFEDHGEVVEVSPPSVLRLTHRSGDSPEHELRFEVAPSSGGSHVILKQDNNADENAAAHSQKNWDTMLGLLKKVVEG